MEKRKVLLTSNERSILILTDATDERLKKVWNCCHVEEALENIRCTSLCMELFDMEQNDEYGREIVEAIGYQKIIKKESVMKKKEETLRMISLSDGTGMGATTIIFQTDAPMVRLRELERVSNDVYLTGSKDMEDVPIWSRVLMEEGYQFIYVDEWTAPNDIDFWLDEKGVFERYVIDDQPELRVSIPCRIGDTCYVIPTKENGLTSIAEMKCLGFLFGEPNNVANLYSKNRFDKNIPKMYQPALEQFGKVVFLSMEDAKKAAGEK